MSECKQWHQHGVFAVFSVFIAIRSFTAKFAIEAVTASQAAKQGRQHSNLNDDVENYDSLKGSHFF